MALPPATSLILVAVVPSRRDLEIARLLGWYRIPLRRAPKVVSVDYLAFYQTGAFGPEHRWQIEMFAEVKGHELVTRRDLFREELDHPRAGEEYYKLQLGSLQSLPGPLRAGSWKRISFFYTTGELMHTASSINELVVKSEDRAVLWRSLRERALQSGQYRINDLPELPVDPMLLALLGGWIKGVANDNE